MPLSCPSNFLLSYFSYTNQHSHTFSNFKRSGRITKWAPRSFFQCAGLQCSGLLEWYGCLTNFKGLLKYSCLLPSRNVGRSGEGNRNIRLLLIQFMNVDIPHMRLFVSTSTFWTQFNLLNKSKECFCSRFVVKAVHLSTERALNCCIVRYTYVI